MIQFYQTTCAKRFYENKDSDDVQSTKEITNQVCLWQEALLEQLYELIKDLKPWHETCDVEETCLEVDDALYDTLFASILSLEHHKPLPSSSDSENKMLQKYEKGFLDSKYKQFHCDIWLPYDFSFTFDYIDAAQTNMSFGSLYAFQKEIKKVLYYKEIQICPSLKTLCEQLLELIEQAINTNQVILREDI